MCIAEWLSLCVCLHACFLPFETFLQEYREEEEVVSPPQRVADMKAQWQQERDLWRNEKVSFKECLFCVKMVWCGVVRCGAVWRGMALV